MSTIIIHLFLHMHKTILCSFILLTFILSCKEKVHQENYTADSNAIQKWTSLIDIHPDDDSLYAARAEVYMQEEKYADAIADLKQAIHIDTTRNEYYHMLSDCYLDMGESYDAYEVMKNATTLFPQRIPTLLKASETFLLLKRYDESRSAINAVLKINPAEAEAYFMLGMNYKETGDTTRAIAAFQSAVERDASITDGWIILGQLWQQKDAKLAMMCYDNAIKSDSSKVEAKFAKAVYLQANEKYSDAILLYEAITSEQIQYTDAWSNKGLCYYGLDSLQRAIECFTIAIGQVPTNAQYYRFRGKTYERMKDDTRATADLDQARRLLPTQSQ
jgi:tetratricopeptide (TPR) repeat protein